LFPDFVLQVMESWVGP